LPPPELILLSFAILLFSLSFHEAAHAWSADRLGDPTARLLGRITLNPLAHIDWIGTVLFPLIAIYSGLPILGWAKPVPVDGRNLRSPRRDFALVAGAGPASNLVLAAIGALLFIVLRGRASEPTGGVFLATGLYQFVQLNVFLAVFNMFPVPPLDGGNVLSGFVPESVARAIDQLRPFGFLIIYALLFTGVLWAVMNPIQLTIMEWLL
jgi:Zn-dependent protease